MDRSDALFATRAGGAALAFGLLVFVLYPAPAPILLLGVILGLLSALIAMGLVLVWRANRIVNFAQGDLGGLSAVLAASLIVGWDWPYLLAAIVGLAAALALGWATEVLVIRRFANAPRLVLTVATIGLAQLFAFGQLGLPRLFDYDVAPQPPSPFDFSFEWFPVVFRGGHLLIVLVVPAVAAGLALFLRRSRFGIAARAAAESTDRAALLGIPVRRINTIVWVLAAGMSGLGVLLRMPIQGVSIGTVLGPGLLLRALAAAVIGRMESLPRTFVAAIGLTVVEQAVFFESGNTVVADAVMFGVILVALLAQSSATERARALGASAWRSVREVRPIPRELQRLPEVRGAVLGGALLSAAVAVLWPLRWGPSDVNVLGVSLIMAIVILSLVVLTGWAGQISLGQLAVVAVTAAAAGRMGQNGHHFFVCLAVAGLLGALLSLAIGLPALRIQGPFFAVTTLAFALAAGTWVLNRDFFPWLQPNIARDVPRPILFDKFDLASNHAYFYVTLLVLVFAIAVVWRLRTSRTGRTLIANRDNTRAAQSFAISPVRAQLTAFAVSGLLAGLAGGLYVFNQGSVSSSIIVTEANIKIFSIGVIGGLASIPGALAGAVYLAFVDYSPFTTTPMSRLLASGLGVLAILMFLPAGLGGLLYDARDSALRWVARRRGIVVPSLLADLDDAQSLLDAGTAGDATKRSRPAGEPLEDALLVVEGLDVAYGKTQILFGVDLAVRRGEILALLGTNGAGKSTLLSAIAGLVAPRSGRVTFDGEDLTGRPPTETIAAGVVLMPGGKGVFPTLTVAENLTLAAWPYAKDPAHVAEATERVLTYFPILRERWDQKAGNLSGGEQQMLTLGQAFLARPRLLMIDELSLGLAPVVVESLLEIVRAIHDNGTTIVLVEQSVNVAITVAERAVFLEKGEVRFDGATADLLDRPEILRSVFLEGASAASGAANPARTGTPSVAADGHRTFVAHCDACGHDHPVLLALQGVSARFGGVRAVTDVDLEVRERQIVGLIGPNGAGKTTILDLISGFVVPSSGRIELAGEDVAQVVPAWRAEKGLGRSFQDARLFPGMTVRETIATAFERHVDVRDPLAAVVLSPAVKMSERVVIAEVDRLVELMRIEAYADKFVGELSTGTRRVVDLACVLAHRPTVLLLDEPASGIAQRETEALAPLLLDIREQTGAAIVVIEHDMPLITSVADELVALEVGEVVARGAPGDVIRDPAVIAGYLGGSDAAIRRSGGRVRRPAPGNGRRSDVSSPRSDERASTNGRRAGAQATRRRAAPSRTARERKAASDARNEPTG